MTPFEQQLQQFFPEIYHLHVLGKSEAHLWRLIDLLLLMAQDTESGYIKIHYNKGHIDKITKEVDMLFNKASRPGY
jgi:hypothetical protein